MVKVFYPFKVKIRVQRARIFTMIGVVGSMLVYFKRKKWF